MEDVDAHLVGIVGLEPDPQRPGAIHGVLVGHRHGDRPRPVRLRAPLDAYQGVFMLSDVDPGQAPTDLRGSGRSCGDPDTCDGDGPPRDELGDLGDPEAREVSGAVLTARAVGGGEIQPGRACQGVLGRTRGQEDEGGQRCSCQAHRGA